MKRHFGSILSVGYLVMVSAVIVPPSSDWLTSWPVFAKQILMRIVVAIAFLGVSPRFLKTDPVSSARITPGPPPPVPEPDPGPQPVDSRHPGSYAAALRFRQRIVYTSVFFLNLVSDWHDFYPVSPSPRGVLAFLWALIKSFCVALFVGSFLNGILFPQKPVRAAADEKERRSLRRRLVFAAFCVLVAASYLVTHAHWWARQLWVDRAVDTVVGTTISLACWACLIVLWLPKPGQMSANDPDPLHVVPMNPPKPLASGTPRTSFIAEP